MENGLKYCIWIRTIQPVHVEIACAWQPTLPEQNGLTPSHGVFTARTNGDRASAFHRISYLCLSAALHTAQWPAVPWPQWAINALPVWVVGP